MIAVFLCLVVLAEKQLVVVRKHAFAKL